MEDVGGGAGEAVEDVGETVEDVGEVARSAVEDVGEGAGEAVEGVGEAAGEAVEDTARRQAQPHRLPKVRSVHGVWAGAAPSAGRAGEGVARARSGAPRVDERHAKQSDS